MQREDHITNINSGIEPMGRNTIRMPKKGKFHRQVSFWKLKTCRFWFFI